MADDIHFVDPVGERVKCGVCYGILDNPESGCQEGHTFCHGCITRLDRCPMRRAPYDQQRGFVKNRAVADLIQTLTVFCKHGNHEDDDGADERPAKKAKTKSQRDADSGNSSTASDDFCDWRGPLSHLQHHMDTTCLFHPVPCSFVASGCLVVRERRAMARHERRCVYRPEQCRGCKQTFLHKELLQHARECGDIIVCCVLCGFYMRRKNKKTHDNESCPEAEIACALAAYGCKKRMKRKDADTHARDYAGSHMAMMAGRILKMESRMQRVESRMQKMSEERGAHIMWRLSSEDIVRQLCSSSDTLFSDWHADGEGVKWRLKLVDSVFGVAVYVQPDRIPKERKCVRISLKQSHTTKQGSHKWEAHHTGSASSGTAEIANERSDTSAKEEEKNKLESDLSRNEEKRDEEKKDCARSKEEEAEVSQALRCEAWGWDDFTGCFDRDMWWFLYCGIELEARVYTDVDEE